MYLYIPRGWTNVVWGGLMAVWGGLIAVWRWLGVIWCRFGVFQWIGSSHNTCSLNVNPVSITCLQNLSAKVTRGCKSVSQRNHDHHV